MDIHRGVQNIADCIINSLVGFGAFCSNGYPSRDAGRTWLLPPYWISLYTLFASTVLKLAKLNFS